MMIQRGHKLYPAEVESAKGDGLGANRAATLALDPELEPQGDRFTS